MSRTNHDINRVKKWINANLSEEDHQKMENTEGDKAARLIVLKEMAKRCTNSGVKVRSVTVRSTMSSHFARRKMAKANVPYAAAKRDSSSRFTVKDASSWTKLFPLCGDQRQRNVIDSFLQEYRPCMDQAAGVVDADHLMGTTRTVWLLYADGSKNELIEAGDIDKFDNLIKLCVERLSELIKKETNFPRNCFVNFYDTETAVAEAHRDTKNIGSIVLVLEATCTSTLEISLEPDQSKKGMNWHKVDMEQGDILAMGPNVTHRYRGSSSKRVALVCFF
jgi:hypothetical protein